MQIITLKENNSEYFTLITYPDGQKSIKLNLEMLDIKKPIKINCRIKNFSELEVLGCLLSALYKNDFYVQHVNFSYLFGIRSDRAFSEGQPNYCRDVLASVINSWKKLFNVETLSILWPFPSLPVKYKYFDETYSRDGAFYPIDMTKPIIGGDETALIFQGIDTHSTFKKIRTDGDLTISLNDEDLESIRKCKQVMIVDDLCDGGATFIEAAKFLREKLPSLELYLFIYHGLFTKGINELLEYYKHIYCTNSYQDIFHPCVTQYKVI